MDTGYLTVSPDKRRAALKHNYGITPEEYDALLESQGGVCAICRNPETRKNAGVAGGTSRLAVDHCHDSSRIRGLLCCACNQSIGRMKEDPQRLRAAADYLEKDW